MDAEQLSVLVEKLDTDKDGSVDFRELVVGQKDFRLKERTQLAKEKIQEAEKLALPAVPNLRLNSALSSTDRPRSGQTSIESTASSPRTSNIGTSRSTGNATDSYVVVPSMSKSLKLTEPIN